MFAELNRDINSSTLCNNEMGVDGPINKSKRDSLQIYFLIKEVGNFGTKNRMYLNKRKNVLKHFLNEYLNLKIHICNGRLF